MKHLFAAALVFSTLLGAAYSHAQEGHPLKGSWVGSWDDNDAHGRSLLVILDWDGQEISGIINPGTDNINITNASLDPDGWHVTIETDHQEDGQRYRYQLEGTLQNIEQAHRSLTGTWRNGGESGNFEMTRQ